VAQSNSAHQTRPIVAGRAYDSSHGLEVRVAFAKTRSQQVAFGAAEHLPLQPAPRVNFEAGVLQGRDPTAMKRELSNVRATLLDAGPTAFLPAIEEALAA
jgi:hypothetical protein